MPMDDASASDNCSDVSITVESETLAGNASNYTIVRTFHNRRLQQLLQADDHCEDTTAPELSISGHTAECSDELTLDDATARTTAVR